jgi:chromosomal replication initiation ATPase DnaA
MVGGDDRNENENENEDAALKREAQDRARAGLAVSLAAFALGVPERQVRCATRGVNGAAYARAVAMYLAHAGFGMSLARVGLAFRRDRSTVAHACHRIEDQRDDPHFDAWINALEDAARSAPEPTIVLEIAA